MNNEQQLIQQYLSLLPKEVQSFVMGSEWREAVATIGTQNNLSEENILALKAEVLLVLLGIENLSDFKTNVTKAVSVTGWQQTKVLADVDALIFTKIKMSLSALEKRNRDADQNTIVQQQKPQIEQKPTFIPSNGKPLSILDEQKIMPVRLQDLKNPQTPQVRIPPQVPQKPKSPNPTTPRYIGDPYRESIE